MSDFDSPWKEALDRYFQPFLALLFPEPHAGIDWSRGYEPLDKELQQVAYDAQTGRAVVDKLFKVWRTTGEEEWVLVHVEVQSQPDTDFAARMYRYHYRLFDKYNRTVVSLAVLGDDRPRWRPSRFGYTLWGCQLQFRFATAKLLDVAADETALLATRNPVAFVVLAHRRAQETEKNDEQRRSYKVSLVRNLFQLGFSREDVRRLFRVIDWFMRLPKELNRLVWQEIVAIEQEKQMPFITSVEEIGFERGLAEGIRQAIELLLETRFAEEGRQLIPDIRRVTDEAALRSLLRNVSTAKTLEDVRTLLRPGHSEGGA